MNRSTDQSGVWGTPRPKGTTVTLMHLITSLRTRVAREEGQTMAEYGVVLAVIALAVIVAFTALSGGISHAINNVAAVLP